MTCKEAKEFMGNINKGILSIVYVALVRKRNRVKMPVVTNYLNA